MNSVAVVAENLSPSKMLLDLQERQESKEKEKVQKEENLEVAEIAREKAPRRLAVEYASKKPPRVSPYDLLRNRPVPRVLQADLDQLMEFHGTGGSLEPAYSPQYGGTLKSLPGSSVHAHP